MDSNPAVLLREGPQGMFCFVFGDQACHPHLHGVIDIKMLGARPLFSVHAAKTGSYNPSYSLFISILSTEYIYMYTRETFYTLLH